MRKSKITQDMSVYEASAFWDEHDFSEFDDVQETKEISISSHKEKVRWFGSGPLCKGTEACKKIKNFRRRADQ